MFIVQLPAEGRPRGQALTPGRAEHPLHCLPPGLPWDLAGACPPAPRGWANPSLCPATQQGLDPGHGAGRTLPTPPAPPWAPLTVQTPSGWVNPGRPLSLSGLFPIRHCSLSPQCWAPQGPGPMAPHFHPVPESDGWWPALCPSLHVLPCPLPAGLSSAGTAARQPGLREAASSPGQRPLGVQAGSSRPLLPPPSKAWPSARHPPWSRSELDLVQINSKARGRLKP